MKILVFMVIYADSPVNQRHGWSNVKKHYNSKQGYLFEPFWQKQWNINIQIKVTYYAKI